MIIGLFDELLRSSENARRGRVRIKVCVRPGGSRYVLLVRLDRVSWGLEASSPSSCVRLSPGFSGQPNPGAVVYFDYRIEVGSLRADDRKFCVKVSPDASHVAGVRKTRRKPANGLSAARRSKRNSSSTPSSRSCRTRRRRRWPRRRRRRPKPDSCRARLGRAARPDLPVTLCVPPWQEHTRLPLTYPPLR